MRSATGLSVMDVAVLDALDQVGARPDRFVKNTRVLDRAFELHDIPPRPGYRVLCDLSRPWVLHLPMVDFNGNAGSPDFGPASPRYTESRLSPLGAAALAAERSEIGPLPIGLINGNTHVDGPWPPFDPTRVLAALRAAADGATDDELVSAVGLPSFPGGCVVHCDHEQLATGVLTELELCAKVTAVSPGLLRITNFAPGTSASEIAMSLVHLAEHRTFASTFSSPPRLPIRDINDSSSGSDWLVNITLDPGTDPVAVIAVIEKIWGVHTDIEVALGQPLAMVLREWIARGDPADVAERLAIIEHALRA